MPELGLAAIQPRTWRMTTVVGQDAQVYPGFLEGVIDLATRMVVGWQMAEHMRTSLVTDALAMARTHGFAAVSAILHSDHGTQGGFNLSSQHDGR